MPHKKSLEEGWPLALLYGGPMAAGAAAGVGKLALAPTIAKAQLGIKSAKTMAALLRKARGPKPPTETPSLARPKDRQPGVYPTWGNTSLSPSSVNASVRDRMEPILQEMSVAVLVPTPSPTSYVSGATTSANVGAHYGIPYPARYKKAPMLTRTFPSTAKLKKSKSRKKRSKG